jgi:SHR-binding domain of vacuolar-sorting associated protein 13
MAERIQGNIRWIFSEPIDVKKIGVRTLAIRKEMNRFKNQEGCEFIKVIIKQIEGTTYVIFEDEDLDFPLYRIENMSSDTAVWYVQKG